MDYYWVRNSKGEPVRIPADKIKDWNPNRVVEASEEEKQRFMEEIDRFFEETIRKLKMKEQAHEN